jgi:hypothetical protein
MALTKKQIEIIRSINARRMQGDIKLIANATGKSRTYISMILNPSSPFYNQEVIDESVKLITGREKKNTNHLKNLDEQSTANATQLQTY